MTNEHKGEGGGGAIDISIGKEIDRSLAEIISALLKPAATEIGSIFGESVGILSDKIRRKRLLNTETGLAEVRKKLEAANIEIETLTPPKEEDIHLLVTGLSLSDDAAVRDLWAGLFAKALEPGSTVTAERAFVSVLQALSPMDAKVIEFLSAVERSDKQIRAISTSFHPNDLRSITPDEAATIARVRDEANNMRTTVIRSLLSTAATYGVDKLSGSEWSDNLVRLGIIERIPSNQPVYFDSPLTWHSLDQRDLQRLFETFNKKLDRLSKTISHQSSPPGRLFKFQNLANGLQMEVKLTSFGTRLAAACGLLD